MPRDAPEYDIIVCGFNKDRVAINSWVRRRHGRTGPVTAGDRVVCLRNEHDLGIFNGMLATVDDARTMKSRNGREIPVLDVTDDMGERFESLPYAPEQFGEEKTLRDVRKEKTLWDFGYALTCHRVQGSEFGRVLVLEQISNKWDPKRWRYTAVTRAADEIVYCVNDRRR
jgi:exodeoxyribonuclease-5